MFNSLSSSYTTVNRYLVSEAGSEIEVYVPHGVVRCAFDNNQIIGKTHIITGTNKVPTSVMTSTSYVQLNQSNLQEKEQLKPLHWMWEDESEELKKNFMELHINKVHVKLLWRTRNAHIQYYLEVVAEQQSYITKMINIQIT